MIAIFSPRKPYQAFSCLVILYCVKRNIYISLLCWNVCIFKTAITYIFAIDFLCLQPAFLMENNYRSKTLSFNAIKIMIIIMINEHFSAVINYILSMIQSIVPLFPRIKILMRIFTTIISTKIVYSPFTINKQWSWWWKQRNSFPHFYLALIRIKSSYFYHH